MNKKLFLGMFAAAGMLFATSCSHEDLIETESGETATVSFVVDAEGAIGTRAIGDGSNIGELAYVVYNETSDCLVAAEQISYSGTTTLSLALAKGQTYKLGFYAYDAGLSGTVRKENGVFIVNASTPQVNNNTFDSFAANLTYTVSGSDLQRVTLKRPVAHINVGIKQEDFDAAVAAGADINSSKVELKGTFATRYSVLDGTVLETTENIDVMACPIPEEVLTVNGVDYKYLLSAIVWPAEIGVSQTVDAKFTFTRAGAPVEPIVLEDGVSNLPIKSNYRTNIIGNVLTGNVDFTVVVDPAFDGENNTALWDGSSVSSSFTTDEEGRFHIKSAEDFALLMSSTRNQNSAYAGKTFVLDTDIDFAGQTITGVGSQSSNFAAIFDGNGHTISNFVIDQSGREFYGGLFCQMTTSNAVVKNLTVKGATVIANKMAGIIASSVEGGAVVENCHVEDCVVIAKIKKAGAIAGYTSNGTVKNCSAKNVAVYCADPTEAGEIVGYENTGSTVTNNTHNNVTVVRGADLVISTVAELVAFANDVNNDNTYAGKTVVLAKDIDLAGIDWTPIGGPGAELPDPFYGTFDGCGHTIKNLNVVEKAGADAYDAIGFFGWLDGVVKNLNFETANVEGHHHVGVVAGHMESRVNGKIENVTVKGATVKSTYLNNDRDGDKAGVIVGFHDAGSVSGAISNSTVEAVRDGGQAVGYSNASTSVNVTATNVTVNGASGNLIGRHS